ncbi:uncharacterized protein HMPREF1541_08008 [Cyphellophora europaea CBS 101466]|uniref:Major facilitator superfamily (MFS) profile domain-containing protein n=1 Tax=Cyphellophora europaea (strain CBS 101466) TaxID=1220924 RepID=W2RL18_CYPE1|nr:uncharacterized protein HMPREF1541_08008 [Cyphellophora europaea CBS 101466]ETN37020.1 hypothetical protein HMPREF1541_08008 [Cyphellophora europaea CBS 101466]
MTVADNLEKADADVPSQLSDAQPGMTSSNMSISSDNPDENAAPPPPWKPTLRLVLAFASLAVLTLMVALDGTSLSVALPTIAEKLQGTALEAFWAGTSFLLASTVFQPTFASLSHIFGRMPVIIVSVTLFLAGVLMAALADNFTLLLVGRTIQGVGGGAIIALTEIIVTDLVPMRFRGQWMGILGAMWALGSVSGPVVGGAFAQVDAWRWIFWLNLPFIGISYVMVVLFLRLNIVPESIVAKLRRVDWIGSFLFVASTTSFLIPLTWGGIMYSWSHWRTLIPLIVGAVGLMAFAVYEKYCAVEPMIRLSVFRNRTAILGYFGTFLHGIIVWTMLYYQPLYYLAVKEYSPVISGVALFPATFTVAPMSVLAGILITKTGSYRQIIWIGWVVSTLGMGLTILLEVDTSIPAWIFINIVPGIGFGLLFPALQFQVQAASTNEDMGFAVGLFVFFRTFGQAIGVAIGGGIFQNTMIRKLEAFPRYAAQAPELAKDAAALVQVIRATPTGTDKLDLQMAYTQSIRVVYIVLTAFCAVGLACSLVIKAYDIDIPLDTQHALVEKRVKISNAEGQEARAGVKS